MTTTGHKGLIAAVGLGIAAVLGAALFASDDAPEPYATSADLPPIPEATTNGWRLVSRPWADTAVEANGDAVLAMVGAGDESASFETRWGAVAQSADNLRKSAQANVHRDALEAWHQAATSERFADGCTVDRLHECHYFQIFRLHQLALIEALSLAVDGEWADADARLAAAVSLDQRFLASCRNSTSCLVSASMLTDALAVTALVLRAQPPGQAKDRRERLSATAARPEGDDIGIPQADFEVKRRAFVGDYLFSRHLLRRAEDEGVDLLVGDSNWPPSISFDPAHTATLIDEVHLDLRSQHGMHLMLTGRDEDAEPTRCSWMDRVTNAIGCAHFNPETARILHDSSMDNIDEQLEIGRRWSRRIQELSPRVVVPQAP